MRFDCYYYDGLINKKWYILFVKINTNSPRSILPKKEADLGLTS